MKKVVVIIPVYNEESSIGHVLSDIPKDIVDEVIVVNNNSTDLSKKVALDHGATVVDEKRKGYGSACLRGMTYIDGLDTKPDIVVFLDGDYSDYPEELRLLVAPIIEEEYDLVLGSRKMGEREKDALFGRQIFGNFVATSLIKLLYNVSFTDLGPFRAIKYEKLLELGMKDKTFGWTVEMQIKAAKNKFKCKEVPVSYRKRIGTSKITGTFYGSVMATYKIAVTIFKYL